MYNPHARNGTKASRAPSDERSSARQNPAADQDDSFLLRACVHCYDPKYSLVLVDTAVEISRNSSTANPCFFSRELQTLFPPPVGSRSRLQPLPPQKIQPISCADGTDRRIGSRWGFVTCGSYAFLHLKSIHMAHRCHAVAGLRVCAAAGPVGWRNSVDSYSGRAGSRVQAQRTQAPYGFRPERLRKGARLPHNLLTLSIRPSPQAPPQRQK